MGATSARWSQGPRSLGLCGLSHPQDHPPPLPERVLSWSCMSREAGRARDLPGSLGRPRKRETATRAHVQPVVPRAPFQGQRGHSRPVTHHCGHIRQALGLPAAPGAKRVPTARHLRGLHLTMNNLEHLSRKLSQRGPKISEHMSPSRRAMSLSACHLPVWLQLSRTRHDTTARLLRPHPPGPAHSPLRRAPPAGGADIQMVT